MQLNPALLAAAAVLATPAAALAQPDAAAIWQVFPRDGGETHLSYGVPETDNVAVGLTCRAHARTIRVGVTLDNAGSHREGSTWQTTIALRSGAARGSWSGRATYGEIGVQADANVPANHPVLRAFAASGQLGSGGETWRARSAAERRAISRFFAACR